MWFSIINCNGVSVSPNACHDSRLPQVPCVPATVKFISVVSIWPPPVKTHHSGLNAPHAFPISGGQQKKHFLAPTEI